MLTSPQKILLVGGPVTTEINWSSPKNHRWRTNGLVVNKISALFSM